jgi:hypothetical protein
MVFERTLAGKSSVQTWVTMRLDDHFLAAATYPNEINL